MTKYEKAIYSMIQESTDHLTVYQVFEHLKKTYPNVARATVYNNLNKLWEMGLIQKISMEGSPDRYDKIEKHDHIICSHCGAIADASFPDLTESLRKQLGESFCSYDLKVYYCCPNCKKNGQH